MNSKQFIQQSKPFIEYMVAWQNNLQPLPLNEIINGTPETVAVISVDVINGFCYEGPLASPRVAGLVKPISQLFRQAHAAGVPHFILTQDSHPADAVEFTNFPPHCIRGTTESETVAEFQQLPFFNEFRVFPKQSLNSALGTALDAWLDEHPHVNSFITVGDCTDLCTHQLAMHLKLRANVRNEGARVILPANCVQTYNLPVSVAQEVAAVPHDGDFLHTVFLYHMMLNGIEVVSMVG